jgi:kynureninase
MPIDFDPIPGAEGWQISNPPILQLAALRASMSIFDRVGMARLRAKSERLTAYLEYLIHHHALLGVSLMTPDDPAQRGAQLSLQIKHHGRALHQRLIEAHIICDWREPDVIRVAPVPLYNTFLDVFTFVNALDAAHREVLVA